MPLPRLQKLEEAHSMGMFEGSQSKQAMLQGQRERDYHVGGREIG